MPRLCTVCTHPQRREIDAALLEHAVGYRVVAGRFGLAPTSVQRHQNEHLGALFQQVEEARRMLDAEALAAKMAAVDEDLQTLRTWGREAHDAHTLSMAIGHGRNNVDTLMRLGVFHAAERQQARERAEEACGHWAPPPPRRTKRLSQGAELRMVLAKGEGGDKVIEAIAALGDPPAQLAPAPQPARRTEPPQQRIERVVAV